MRRLTREHPELFDQVIAGELTPNAAARLAGFRRETWQVPKDPIAAGMFLAKEDFTEKSDDNIPVNLSKTDQALANHTTDFEPPLYNIWKQ